MRSELDRLVEKVPLVPGKEDEDCVEQTGDALVVVCSARIASDQDRATVIIYARVERLVSRGRWAARSKEAGVPSQTVRRLLCEDRSRN